MHQKKTFSSRLASAVPWIFFAGAWFLIGYLVKEGNSFWRSYLQAIVLFRAGLQGLWIAFGHLIFPLRTARRMGLTSPGFQTEIGAVHLAFGITGVLSFFYPEWVIPVALIVAIFYGGSVYAQIRNRIIEKKATPANSGPMFYYTLLMSLSLFIAIFMVWY